MNRIITLALNLFLNLLYTKLSWSYDFIANFVSAGMWKSWVFELAKEVTGSKILELGHGPGHLYSKIAKDYPFIVAIDASYYMNRKAFANFLRTNTHPPNIISCKTQLLAFRNCSFDTIIASFPTSYIIDPMTVGEVYRILNPGGTILILPAAWITGTKFRQRLSSSLFKITHQVPVNILDSFPMITGPYEKKGFEVHLKYQELQYSTVVIVVAVKPKGKDQEIQ